MNGKYNGLERDIYYKDKSYTNQTNELIGGSLYFGSDVNLNEIRIIDEKDFTSFSDISKEGNKDKSVFYNIRDNGYGKSFRINDTKKIYD